MPWSPSRQQRKAIMGVVAVLFGGALALGLLALWYYQRTLSGDGADDATALLRTLVEDRGVFTDTIRVLLASLPAFAMVVCTRKEGVLSRFGIGAFALLLATFIVVSPTAIWMDVASDSPETPETAKQIIQLSKDLAKFSLTYMFMLLGLATISIGTDTSKRRKNKRAPKRKTGTTQKPTEVPVNE